MSFTTRPVLRCRRGVVAAGHYLGAQAGQHLLAAGGNAIDAAAAASFVCAVVEPHLGGLAGEVPILIHSAREGRVVAISGQGPAPALATIDHMRGLGLETVPGDGLLPASVPAFVDAWIVALERYGTKTLGEVIAPAIEVAREGWAAQRGLVKTLTAHAERFRGEWPTTAATFLPDGLPTVGGRVRNPDLAASLALLAAAERGASSRAAGLESARDVFYRGEIAARIDRHAREVAVRDASGGVHGALLRGEDLAAYRGRVEEPLSIPFRNTTVFKCSTWTQGAVFLQQLRLLEQFDLERLGHNSADYLHVWLECNKLAFADREVHYGDPDHAAVPFERLLSADYAAARRDLVDLARASELLRPGDRAAFRVEASPEGDGSGGLGEPSAFMGDTTHVDAADAEGNLVAATPSGGWLQSSPVVAGLGFPLGTRAQMVSLDPQHPNALAPGKRPRATLTPSIAYRDGRPWMAFGTPGGDMQDQWTLQFFLNVVVFGQGLQAAIDAPTVHSLHAPASFYPREAVPCGVSAEGRIAPEVVEELRARGHQVSVPGSWEHGRVQAVTWEEGRFLCGAASPRRETAYVAGW